MSGGGKGGSQTTKVEIPQWAEDAAKGNLAKADEISKLGYVPYMGPDVAAFQPGQTAAFQNTNDMASAFGMSGGQSAMPTPETYAGGVQGYSAFPMFEQAQQQLAQQRPGQANYIDSFFIDPMTGAPSQQQAMPQPSQPLSYGGGGGGRDRGTVASRSRASSRNDTGMTPANAYVPSQGGGWSPVDFIDGGGLGASGDTFEGGGLLSTAANVITDPVGSSNSSSSGTGGGK